MKAVAFSKFGGPDVLEVIELPIPQPGPDDVVVRIAAATVNPTDIMMRSGKQAALMVALTPPYVAGMEFSGHIYSAGSGVMKFQIGQPVMGVVNPRRSNGGSQAEYLCVPAKSVAMLDPSIDLVQAATVPMNGLTAKIALDLLSLQPGNSVLVTGAAGAVGGYFIQLAKTAGLKVVADAKEGDIDTIRGLGADHIVPRGPTMVATVRALFPQGVDALLDTALIGDVASAAVRDDGSAVSLRKSNPITDTRLRTHYVAVTERMEDTPVLEWLAELIRTGEVTPRVGCTLPMTEASAANALVERGNMRGRMVLLFNDAG